MNNRAVAPIAWTLCGICVVLTGIALAFSGLDWGAANPVADEATYDALEVVLLAFPIVGALVASRYPTNSIGWIFCGVGLSLAVSDTANGYGVHGLIAEPGSLPWANVMAWLSEWLFIPGLVLAWTLLLLLFPSGALPSPRWRPIALIAIVGTCCLAVVLALNPGPLSDAPFKSVDNPFGVDAIDRSVELVSPALWLVTLGCCVVAAVSLVLRFRRSSGVERVQLKWIAYAGALFVPLFIGTGAAPHRVVTLVQLAALIAVAMLPVATGIAILRYRLYEIDRLISRTLVYGSLTVLLGAAYAGFVLAGQALFSSFAGGSNLAIAVSTLVVAALFLPIRARVQAVVDSRFYRRRYDTQRTLEAFGARLREQIQLETLTGELRGVVVETMQPAHVSLWLRQGAGS